MDPANYRTNAESTPKQPIQPRPTDQFRSLNRQARPGRPLNNPALLASRLTAPMPFKAKAPKHGKPTQRLHIMGSTSPQPKLSVPQPGNGNAERLKPGASRQHLRPHATGQSTPVRSHDGARGYEGVHGHGGIHGYDGVRSHEGLRDAKPTLPKLDLDSRAPPAHSEKNQRHLDTHIHGLAKIIPCKVDGRPSSVQHEEGSNFFYVGSQRFEWNYSRFDVERVDNKGEFYKFVLHYGNAKRSASFVVDYENRVRFKLVCDTHKAPVTPVGNRDPPESVKTVPAKDTKQPGHDPPTIDVTILNDDKTQKASIFINERGLYVNNKHKKFAWPLLRIVRGAQAASDSRVAYDLYYEHHHLKLELGRAEANVLDRAAREHGVSTPPNSSGEAGRGSPHKSHTEPKAESSPKSSPKTQSEQVPSTSPSAPDERKRKLKYLPKPSPRPLRDSSLRPAASSSPGNASTEIPPEDFYGKETKPAAQPPSQEAGKSGTEPINLTSPEKPGRRTRRRTRASMEELEEDAPVEPTDEDFQLLRNDGFHRVAHRFWDGRLMEVSVEDIARLNPRIYVNDNIIWFFLRWNLEQLYTHDRSMFDKILLLNTFFYPEIRKGESPKWVTKLPILSKHITVMPIHESSHWSVAIIVGLDEAMKEESNVKPAIVVLDSLGPAQNHQTFRKVVSVLRSVLKMHNRPQLTTRDYRSLRTTVPVQTNLTDCGVYLLHYVEQIFERPDVFLDQVNSAQDRTLDMGEFWREPELQTKRDYLKRKLKRLGSEESSMEDGTSYNEEDDDIEVVGMEQVRRKRRKADASQTPEKPTVKTDESSKAQSHFDKKATEASEETLEVRTTSVAENRGSNPDAEERVTPGTPERRSEPLAQDGYGEIQDLTDDPDDVVMTEAPGSTDGAVRQSPELVSQSEGSGGPSPRSSPPLT